MHPSINPGHAARGERPAPRLCARKDEQNRLPRGVVEQAVAEESRHCRKIGKTVGLGTVTAAAITTTLYLVGLMNGLDTRITIPTNTIWTALMILSGAVFGLRTLVQASAHARGKADPVALGQALFHGQVALVLGFAASALGAHGMLSAIADGLSEGAPPPGPSETGTILAQLGLGIMIALFAAQVAALSETGLTEQLRSARRRLLAVHLRSRITTDPTKNPDAVDRWIVALAHLIIPCFMGVLLWRLMTPGGLPALAASIGLVSATLQSEANATFGNEATGLLCF